MPKEKIAGYNESLIMDTGTGAVLSTNSSSYKNALSRRQLQKKKKQEIVSLHETIDQLIARLEQLEKK